MLEDCPVVAVPVLAAVLNPVLRVAGAPLSSRLATLREKNEELVILNPNNTANKIKTAITKRFIEVSLDSNAHLDTLLNS